ncbi:hypothetical protein [Natrinema soli]|uniref:Amidohydrolase n=1 Tax=Natrinema soli TaxID=1930624 RepID=A0ABD5SIK8_9EURY|nr:hypothetical protein [Natrinema soli]
MAQTQGKSELVRSLDDLTIVDTDSHVTETLDDLVPYVEHRNPGVVREHAFTFPVESM